MAPRRPRRPERENNPFYSTLDFDPLEMAEEAPGPYHATSHETLHRPEMSSTSATYYSTIPLDQTQGPYYSTAANDPWQLPSLATNVYYPPIPEDSQMPAIPPSHYGGFAMAHQPYQGAELLTGPYQPATTPDPWHLPPMSNPPLHSNVAYSPLDAPEKSTNPFWSQRPSSRPDSSASTVKVPSIDDDEPPAQTAIELSKMDSKGAKMGKEEDEVDPFEHLPENEASILRKRKYYYRSNGHHFLT
jgi:hypothetical protein